LTTFSLLLFGVLLRSSYDLHEPLDRLDGVGPELPETEHHDFIDSNMLSGDDYIRICERCDAVISDCTKTIADISADFRIFIKVEDACPNEDIR
jgi:hypothetical protein